MYEHESHIDKAWRYIEGGSDIVWDGESEIYTSILGGNYDDDNYNIEYDFKNEQVIFEPGAMSNSEVIGSGQLSFTINLYNDKTIKNATEDEDSIFKDFGDSGNSIFKSIKEKSSVSDILGADEDKELDLSKKSIVNFKTLKNNIRNLIISTKLH